MKSGTRNEMAMAPSLKNAIKDSSVAISKGSTRPKVRTKPATSKAVPRPPVIELTASQKAAVAEARRQILAEKPEILIEARKSRAATDSLQVTLRNVFILLKHERQRQGLTLQMLADATGIGKASLSRLERDESPNVQLATLQRIADALGKQLILGLADANRR